MSDDSSSKPKAAFDFGEEAPRFRAKAEAETDKYRRLAERLSKPTDQVLADIGCGAASMALALAETHPGARVAAIDAEQAMIDIANERATERGLELATAACDVNDPEALTAAIGAPADLVWAGHVLHHAVDPQAALDNLAGLLAPSGRLAIGEGGVTAQYLPWNIGLGRPGLELRLIEAGSRRLEGEAAEHGAKPLTYGWNLALERAGLGEVQVFNDLVAVPAPLEGKDLEHALKALRARVDWFEDYLSDEDRETWKALLDEEGPHWLGARRDLHQLGIESVYMGTKR